MNARIGIDLGARSARLAWRPNSAEKPLPLGEEISIAQAAGWREDLNPFPALKSALFDGAPFSIENRQVDALQTVRRIFAHLHQAAERLAGAPVEACSLAVPARAGSQAREHFRQAALAGGFQAIELINETTAVILYQEPSPASEQRVLVYSLGENGLQVLLAANRPGSLQALATAGDVDISGRRFTQWLAGLLDEEIHRLGGPGLNPRAIAPRLWGYAEQAKQGLSAKDVYTIADPDLDPSGRWSGRNITLERADFEALIAEDVQRSLALCQQALLEAGLSGPQDIDQVWLEGGSARIPLIRRTLEQWWGRPPLRANENAVAFGAALQARRIELSPLRHNPAGEAQPPPAAAPAPGSDPLQQLAARRAADLQVFQPTAVENPARLLAGELTALEPLLQAGQFDQAIPRLEDLQHRLHAWTADLYFQRGQQHEQAGRGEQAVADYRRAIEIDPQHPQAQGLIHRQEARLAYRQALQMVKDDKLYEALKAIKLAVEKVPDNSNYRDTYITIVSLIVDAGIKEISPSDRQRQPKPDFRLKKINELIALLQRAIETTQDSAGPDRHLNRHLAILYARKGNILRESMGDIKNAILCYKQSLELDPAIVEVKHLLADSLVQDAAAQISRLKGSRLAPGIQQVLAAQIEEARQLAGDYPSLIAEIRRLEDRLR